MPKLRERPTDLDSQLAALERMSTGELCERYLELFGQPVRTRHRTYLIRKIAWRIQALAEGDLSERARRRAAELANDADVRVMPPRPTAARATLVPGGQRVVPLPPQRDKRLPASGTTILRAYKGTTLRVAVTDDGFEYEGQRFKTLSAVAKTITGSHMNGFRFFGLEVP